MKNAEPPVIVRRPTAREHDEVCSCVVNSYLRSHTLGLLVSRVQGRPGPDGFRLIAATSDAIVGATEVSINANSARIEYLCTAPAVRGHGAGRLLLDNVWAELAHREVTQLVGWVVRAEPGQTWMRRQGFLAKSSRTLVRASNSEARRAGFLNPGMNLVDGYFYADIVDHQMVGEWFSHVYVQDLMVHQSSLSLGRSA